MTYILDLYSGFIPDVSFHSATNVNQHNKSFVLTIRPQGGALFELFLQE